MDKARLGAFVSIALICSTILGLHSYSYYPLFVDDALISLQYIKRMLAGLGLTWTDGPPVEGYSNLLWMLLLAIPGALGMDLILAARVLGLLCMGLVPLLLVAFRAKCSPLCMLAVSPAVMFFPLSSAIAVWAIAGLEVPLLAVLLAIDIVLLFALMDSSTSLPRYVTAVSIVHALLALTRPDGILFVLPGVLVYFLNSKYHHRIGYRSSALKMILFPLFAVAGQMLFRLVYYGDFIPNTARVKLVLSDSRLLSGYYYVKTGLSVEPWFWLLVGIVLLFLFRHRRAHAALLGTFFAVWGLYVIGIGGDHFDGVRHLVPFYVLAVATLLEGAVVFLHRAGKTDWKRPIVVTAIGIIMLPLFHYVQPAHWLQPVQVHHEWVWRGRTLARLLRTVYAEQRPLLGVTAAGCIPYWSDFPAIDMLGLNDRYLAEHPPTGHGQGWVGHDIGDENYVLRREPDIVIFTAGKSTPQFFYSEAFADGSRFRHLYRALWIMKTGPDPYFGAVWLRLESPKVGIREHDAGLTIPGVFFASEACHAAQLTEGRVLATPIYPGETVTCLLPREIPESAVIRINQPGAARLHTDVRDGTILSIYSVSDTAFVESVSITWK